MRLSQRANRRPIQFQGRGTFGGAAQEAKVGFGGSLIDWGARAGGLHNAASTEVTLRARMSDAQGSVPRLQALTTYDSIDLKRYSFATICIETSTKDLEEL